MRLDEDKTSAPPRPAQPTLGGMIVQALKGIVAAGAVAKTTPKARLGSAWFKAKRCGGCGGSAT